MSTPAAAVPRPFGISFLSVLLIIGGAFDILSGILLLIERNDREVLTDLDFTSNQITWAAIIAMVIGVVAILLAMALRNGSEFARWFIGLLAAIRLVELVIAIVRWDTIHWYHAIVPFVIYSLVAGYLFFDEDAKRFFDRSTTF